MVGREVDDHPRAPVSAEIQELANLTDALGRQAVVREVARTPGGGERIAHVLVPKPRRRGPEPSNHPVAAERVSGSGASGHLQAQHAQRCPRLLEREETSVRLDSVGEGALRMQAVLHEIVSLEGAPGRQRLLHSHRHDEERGKTAPGGKAPGEFEIVTYARAADRGVEGLARRLRLDVLGIHAEAARGSQDDDGRRRARLLVEVELRPPRPQDDRLEQATSVNAQRVDEEVEADGRGEEEDTPRRQPAQEADRGRSLVSRGHKGLDQQDA